MFEITPDDTVRLSDEDLRTLVGLLCEAELRARGLPASAVTWGGDQNAPDGGIDVRVALPVGTAIDGFVPRACVGFQVKKTEMTPATIELEMRPSGVLRPSIRELAANGGAYVLVSSGTHASDSALDERRAAMRRALGRIESRNAIFVDFYDRGRLATWVRSHAGAVVWARDRVGRALPGWRPYEAWAFSPEGLNDAYLTEDHARLHAGSSDEKGMSVVEGIQRIRDCLRAPGGIVRLVGVSGVGKTRLVQALFDLRVGKGGLDPALAIYTDMADGPNPQPTGMALDLIATRTPAILVIDNCPPDLHHRLSDRCRASDSTVSVVTIEYDIQDDQAEGTDVFRLEPSSPELVRQLIRRRHTEISHVDAHTIAEFSGGNARVGLALANTLERNETLAGLSHPELFRRLFHQRQAPNEDLLRAAQACALVYSFEGEATSGAEAELPKLGAIAGMSAQELFGKVAELKRRDLLQRRGVWRAVMPHAIANGLAAMALQNFPVAAVEAAFDTERLMRSFSRRLSHLHESEEAVRLVEGWLAQDGKLGNPAVLNDLGDEMFANIAPVSPRATLEALERAAASPAGLSFDRDMFSTSKMARLVHSLAYDPALFDRSVVLMIQMAEAEAREGERDEVAKIFQELFHIHFSGTKASIEQRVWVVEGLLRSGDSVRCDLGVLGVSALLKASNFHSSHSFAFGAWPRDFGYWPAKREDIERWYSSVIGMLEPLAVSNDSVGKRVRRTLATRFQAMWRAGIHDDLERVCHAIQAKHDWHEGWIAIRKTQRRGARQMSEESRTRLAALERLLRPTALVPRVRAIVLTEMWGPLDFADTDSEGDGASIMAAHERAGATAEALGNEVAMNTTGAFPRLLPELVQGSGGRHRQFGIGLARATPNRRAVWQELVGALAVVPKGSRNLGVLCGYLNGLANVDPALCDEVLEESVTDATLARWFPALQTSVPLNGRAAARLKRALAEGKAPISEFTYLSGGRATDPLSGVELADLLRALMAQPDGFGPAVQMLAMRIHSDKDAKRVTAPELLAVGRELLIAIPYGKGDDMRDHSLQTIVSVCLLGDDGASVAGAAVCRFKGAVADGDTYAQPYDDFLKALFKVQSKAVLDAFFGGKEKDRNLGVRVIRDICYSRENPLDGVSGDFVLAWCEEEAAARYPLIASIIVFARRAQNGPQQWDPLALQLLERAPNPAAVLDQFISRFEEDQDGGRLSAVIESRLPLLDEPKLSGNPALAELVRGKREELRGEIERHRKWELELDRNSDERFE